MSCNSGNRLFCSRTDNTFEWFDQTVLPGRCVGCPHQLCFDAVRERVRDNLNQAQLQFDFDMVEA